MVFHWRLSDSKSPQVSRILLSIMTVFNNAVVWMVSTRLPTSKSSRSFNNPLVIVPNAPITIGIIVTFMFHSFFNSLARSKYLSLFSHSFSFILSSAGTAKSTILQIFLFFFVDYYCLVFWPRLGDPFVCQSTIGVWGGGARGVVVIVLGKWTRRLEFKSWTRLIAFHIALIPLGKVWIQLFSLQLWVNSRTD